MAKWVIATWHRIKADWRIRRPALAVAVIAALVLAIMPRGVQIQSDGLLSISLSTAQASETGIVDYLELAPKDSGGELLGTAAPVYAVVNKSGTCERYGVVQVRLDLCLSEGAYRYDDPRFYVVDESSAAYIAGYTGKLDKKGVLVDQVDYDKWYESLPRVWLEQRVFHSHFIYLDPYEYSEAAIQAAMALHLPNFYAAWCADWADVQGGMRHGFDTATRIRPPRYEDAQRTADCLLAVEEIESVAEFVPQGTAEGQTFPSTDIDVGSAATNRATNVAVTTTQTVIDYNNAANATGSIDTVEAYWDSANTGNSIKVGTFSDGGSYLMTCRDAESIGTVAGGYGSYTGLDIDVGAGDYIGCDERAKHGAALDRDISGGAGVLYASGQYCDPSDQATFWILSADIVSLYGTGDTPAVPSITLDCSTYNFGVVKVGQTYNSTLDYFNLTNNGDVAVNVTIGATDATNATAGTDNWTLADNATPGVSIYGLKAGLSSGDFDIIVKKSAAFNNLVVNLAADASQPWGIKLYTPTEINNGDPKRLTVTLTAAAA